MQIFLKVSMGLSIILISLGCAQLPPFPEVYQCQYNGTPRAFYCVDTTTKKQIKVQANDPVMKAAQCLSSDDYKEAQSWIKEIKSLAEQHCK